MSTKTIIVNYGMGNLHSIQRKLYRLKEDSLVSSDAKEILAADKLILPGVGHFKNAMGNLNSLQIIDALNEAVLVKKKPILGICLGMQLFANKSEEGFSDGLGWIDADVIRFRIQDTRNFKIPHMGWNTINMAKQSLLMKNIAENAEFYFVHSYHLELNNQSDLLNETHYEYPFASAVEKDNIFGVQYHPEKSHDMGERLLKNFIEL
ncbi:MAG: imidazole glycerol phosphate synthase, glutamine amidotransferase subunit [Bacteroidetes bacterium GWA2_40_14]|jgi:glutamine amidotransferase|nr:MAG: imidazole glycerol phosphate synthase, glutamine amidotransferase subunit [Bacteroidetes bacterium GWA2_40_14]HAZ02187.1 imidazole glycerol phosphate synthase subunit HisH [Marinilabiliales bacterium]